MLFSKNEQSHVNANGDVAGRDNVKNTVIINPTPSSLTYIQSLYARFKDEKGSNQQIQEIMEELMHYTQRVVSEEVIGLDAKLEQGNRQAFIPTAKEYKEKFAKKLLKYEYYESAQEIYAYILAEVKTNFDLHVYPHIQQNSQLPENTNLLIDEFVIKPIQEKLGENVLRIFKDDINGMIFYLTGNCHLKWI